MDTPKDYTKELQELFSGKAEYEAMKHVFGENGALSFYDKTVINLAAGCPGPDLLAGLPSIFRSATKHRLELEEKNSSFLFQYGPNEGWTGMRKALAEFLTKNYGDTVNSSDLLLSCGATYGLQLLVTCLLAPSAVIFVEEHTYMIALDLFKEFPSFIVVKVPLTTEGVDVEKFKEIATRAKANSTCKVSKDKPFWSMFYTIPNFQNPTGCVLSRDKCQILVETARELDILIVCDDVYNLLYYGNNPYPPARLFSYDKPTSPGYAGGHVVSNASFSKILSPGLRVGWLETPPRVKNRLCQSGILESGGSVNNVIFGIVQSIIELGYAEQRLELFKKTYKERLAATYKALSTHLPPNCSFKKTDGGYFVWIEVPVNAADFIAWCKTRGGPRVLPSTRFIPTTAQPSYVDQTNEKKSQAIRLSIGFHDAETLEKSIEDLAKKLAAYIEEVEKLD